MGMVENFYTVTNNVVKFFFGKLDKMFEKHNQHPFGLEGSVKFSEAVAKGFIKSR